MKKYVFYSFLTLAALFSLLPFIFLETYELDFSMKKVFENLVIFGLLSFVLSVVFHDHIFRPTDSKSKLFSIIIKGFKIVFGTFLTFMFVSGLTSGLLLSINSYIGKQETISINCKVLTSREATSKIGRKHFYITIQIPNEERNVELKVKRQYQRGETFKGQLKKGSLNMYYN
jgi:hypothetical protein